MAVPPAAEPARCLAELSMIALAIPCLAEPFLNLSPDVRTSLFAREEPARNLRLPAVFVCGKGSAPPERPAEIHRDQLCHHRRLRLEPSLAA